MQIKFRTPNVSPSSLVHHATIYDAAAEVARIHDAENHPYFVWMVKPETQRHAFMTSQMPFRHGVDAFAQCLAAVLARTPSIKRRLATVFDNVNDEHGHGSYHLTHPSTFETFLRSIGATDEELAVPPPISARAAMEFNLSYSLTHTPEQGGAFQGIIELIYVKCASMIANTIAARQWGDVDAQNHYRVHEELDVSHSRDLLLVAGPTWEEHPHMREMLAEALLQGAYWLWNLYYDMLPVEAAYVHEEAAAARRNFRRRPLVAPCHVVMGDKIISGQLRDASESGICMDLAEMVAPNTKVDLRIANPKSLDEITLRGLVHWCTKADESGPAKLGAEILASDAQMTEWKTLLQTLTAPTQKG